MFTRITSIIWFKPFISAAGWTRFSIKTRDIAAGRRWDLCTLETKIFAFATDQQQTPKAVQVGAG